MGRRGSVLLLAIFLMVILFYVGVTFHRLLPTERHAVNRMIKDSQVYYAADAGLRLAVAAVEADLEKGRPVKQLKTEGELGGFLWKTDLRPLRSARYRCRVEVTDKQLSKTLDVVAELEQKLYCRYAWFQDQLLPQKAFPVTGFRISGPVHFNSELRVRGLRSEIWRRGRAPFRAGVTVAETTSDDFRGDGVRYLDASEAGWVNIDERPYDADGNTRPDRYRRLFLGGKADLRTGLRRVPMVDFRQDLSSRALSSLASADGDTVRIDVENERAVGGVFIQGDVFKIDLLIPTASSRTARIQTLDRNRYFVVTEALFGPVELANATLLKQGQTAIEVFEGPDTRGTPRSTLVYDGLTNGLIYCEGSIGTAQGGGLKGTNRGLRTVAAAGTIYLAGDLLPAEVPGLGRPTVSGGDNLGVVAGTLKVNLPSNGGPQRLATDPLYLYGSYYAGGVSDGPDRPGLVVEDPYTGSGGSIQVVGGIQLAASNGGQEDSGLALKINFDPNIVREPPPYYPRLPRLKLLNWKETRP